MTPRTPAGAQATPRGSNCCLARGISEEADPPERPDADAVLRPQRCPTPTARAPKPHLAVHPPGLTPDPCLVPHTRPPEPRVRLARPQAPGTRPDRTVHWRGPRRHWKAASTRPRRSLPRQHRGLPAEHARRAAEWKLDSLTSHPRELWSLVRPEYYHPPPRRAPHVDDDSVGTVTGTDFSWEDGNGIQRGWAGRSH